MSGECEYEYLGLHEIREAADKYLRAALDTERPLKSRAFAALVTIAASSVAQSKGLGNIATNTLSFNPDHEPAAH